MVKTLITFLTTLCCLISGGTGLKNQPVLKESQSESENTVNVGYYITDYFSMKKDNGDYYGYAYDYLQEINSISRWKINIVEDSFGNLVKKLLDPEDDSVQLMMGLANNVELYKDLCFTSSPISTTQYEIYTKVNSPLEYNDLENLKGKKCGVMKGNMQVVELNKFSTENSLDIQVVNTYTNNADMITALDNGDIDMLYASDLADRQEYKVLKVFDEIGVYFAAKHGRKDIVDTIEQAMYQIKSINPLFTYQLADKYYNLTTTSVPNFTTEELAYVKSLKDKGEKIKTVCDPTWEPLEFFTKDGTYSGIFADIYAILSQKSGLEFDFIKTDSFEQSTEYVADGRADVVTAVTKDYSYVKNMNVFLSTPFFSSKVSIISNGPSVDLNHPNIVMPKSYYLTTVIQDRFVDNVKVVEDYDACFEYVKKNSNAMTIAVTPLANYIKTNYIYDGLYILDSTISTSDFAIGVNKQTDPLLLSIINKSIQMIDSEDVELIVAKYSVYPNSGVGYFFYLNRMLLTTIGLIVVVVALAIFILISLMKRKRNSEIRIEQKRLSIALNYVSADIYEMDNLSKKLKLLSKHNLTQLPSDKEIGLQDMFTKLCGNDYQSVMDEMKLKGLNEHLDFVCTNEGLDFWLRVDIKNIDARGQKTVLVFSDVTSEHEMRDEASKDYLTGLNNRRALVKEFNSNPQIKCLILFDIDNFKHINDTLGHTEGDVTLKDIADILNTSFKDEYVGRLGGDEFIALTSSYESGKRCAKDALSKTLDYARMNNKKISLSAGICQLKHNISFDEAYKDADSAMYESKKNGKGKLEIFKN